MRQNNHKGSLKKQSFDVHDGALLAGAAIAVTVMWYMRWGVFLCLLLFLPINTWAATYYVTPAGSGSGNGTSWSNAGAGVPWLRSQSLPGSGDTIYFGKGNYLDAWVSSMPINTNSGDRTALVCSAVVNPFLGQMPSCSLCSGKQIVNSSNWVNISGSIYKHYLDLGYDPQDGGFVTYTAFQGFDGSNPIWGAQDYSTFASAANGSFYYNSSGANADTVFVKCTDGGNPNNNTISIGGRSFWGPGWSFTDSNRQFVSIVGFYAYAYQYGLIHLASSTDSNFIENCWIEGVGGTSSQNNGAMSTRNILSRADVDNYDPWGLPSGYCDDGQPQVQLDSCYELYPYFNGKYNMMRRCRVRYMHENLDGAWTRAAVTTTYDQSYMRHCSVYVDLSTIGHGISWKNQFAGGNSIGNVLCHSVLTGNNYPVSQEVALLISNYQVSDSVYGNTFVGVAGPLQVQPRRPFRGLFFCNNTVVQSATTSGGDPIFNICNIGAADYYPLGPYGVSSINPPMKFMYNVVYGRGSGTDRLFISASGNDDSCWIIDSNLYYNMMDSTSSGVATSTTGDKTWAQWKALTTGQWYSGTRDHDAHSTFNTKNPNMTNPLALDVSRPLADTTEMDNTYGGQRWRHFGAWQSGGAAPPADNSQRVPHIKR